MGAPITEPTDDPTDAELLAIAAEAARVAAQLLLPRFGSERAIATKSTDTDLVSAADIEAEQAIRALIVARLPDDAILGEEGDDVTGSSGRRWIIDPIDGTVNFLYGLPQWCVSVACEGRVGVVFDPVRDELFSAVVGGSAALDGHLLRPGDPGDLAHALVATGFGYDSQRRRLQAAEAARVLPQARDIRRLGSAALDLAWCAAGRCDAYWERGVKEWDIAAGEIICAAAGRVVHRLESKGELPGGILAAAPTVAEDLKTIVTA